MSAGVLVFMVPLLAVALDFRLGEAPRWHPLVGFGRLSADVERRLNRAPGSRRNGLLAWSVTVLIPVALALGLELLLASYTWGYPLMSALVLYWAIGWQSLREHVLAVEAALASNDLPLARQQVARIVSRDCQGAGILEVRRAAIESALENSSDAIIGPIFWFVVAGIPGVILYRLSNTLDAMWGYRNFRYRHFGWAAARIDDLLSYVPARLTALGLVLFGKSSSAWTAWRRDAPLCASPNAGPVICAGAGALGLRLGGPCSYHGQVFNKPWLGGQQDPRASDISASLRLVNRCAGFWVLASALLLAWLDGPLAIRLEKLINVV